ncbi:hypothetical protein FB567DRAFT_196463 [Paraphoma chrysanthemicola]|uniref:Uncharacterized protein n=1 Tax=Paraphoma chrysanthemicola TaxID=798071 RepID=A0A8K0VTW8_9PLEO|nr:hypothetical protein FB567DRAFT_196463 [Paraphoma chrysanthemicola]
MKSGESPVDSSRKRQYNDEDDCERPHKQIVREHRIGLGNIRQDSTEVICDQIRLLLDREESGPVFPPHCSPTEEIPVPGPQSTSRTYHPARSKFEDEMLAQAQGYLNNIIAQIDEELPTLIPGIPRDYMFDFEHASCLTPHDIWSLRHLDPSLRFDYFCKFVHLCQRIREATSMTAKYYDMWLLLRYDAWELIRAELRYYSQFGMGPGRHEKQPPGHVVTWGTLTAMQEMDYRVDYSKRPLQFISQNQTSEHASSSLAKIDWHQPSPTWPLKQASIPAPSIQATGQSAVPTTAHHQQLHDYPDISFETQARDQLNRHKKGEDIGARPKYKAEHMWAATGSCSKYPWMAWADSREQEEQELRARHRLTNDNGLQPLSQEENMKLHIAKRCWDGDEVPLPEYPEEEPENYSKWPDGKTWRCLHKDYACADGSCTKQNHACCRTGYTLSKIKAAIRKSIATWKSQVERLIREGQLDPRHKTWAKRQNRAIAKAGTEAGPSASKVSVSISPFDGTHDNPGTTTLVKRFHITT